MYFITVITKLNQQPLLQYSASHDPSEIILVCCDELATSPLFSASPRPLIATLHQAPDGSGCVREEGRLNSQVQRSGDEASFTSGVSHHTPPDLAVQALLLRGRQPNRHITDLVLKTNFLILSFTFTFMHLADAFIQSDLQLHSGYTFSLVCAPFEC